MPRAPRTAVVVDRPGDGAAPPSKTRRKHAMHALQDLGEGLVSPDVYAELVRSPDEGVAEFLDLARVKPNTLGNSRMLKHL